MMETIFALSNNVTGRDKLYRITQYGSKFLSWYMKERGKDDNIIKSLKALEKSMSTSRKLFRFGRSAESLRSAQRAINLQNYLLRITLTMSHTNKAFYLLIDHYIWLGRVGLLSVDLKKWTDTASKFWLASLILALIRDFYALHVSAERFVQSSKLESGRNVANPRQIAMAYIRAMRKNPQAALDMAKNSCDVVIPATSLGYLKLNNGVVGLCGVASSVLALLQVADPTLKLKPN